ncbi:MAG TPA: IPT/TIG domain-containing protein, partial [Polyangia bacterium]
MLLAAGCATSGYPDVVDVRDVSTTFGPPSVSRIRDAGAVRLPQTGAWKGEPDGIAGPGELLVIEGDNFGRLPTVSIGGRATTIVARTEGGGIVARVPTGVPVGNVPIVVSQPKGRAQKSFPMRRFAVVAHAGQLTFLRVDKDRAEPVGKPLPVPGARVVRISGDGAAAYAVANRADGDHLVAVDLCAPGGPRIASEKKLAHHGVLLATAMDAPIAAVVGDGEITIVSTRDARQP